MKTRVYVHGPAMLVWLGLTPMQFAQDAPAEIPVASAQIGRATAQLSRTVVLDALPQIRAGQIPGRRSIPAPRTGVSEQEYRARKARSAVPTAISTTPMPPPALETSTLPETPSASVSFAGSGESACGYIPPDQALAVGATYVLQAVNSCISVFTKTGVLQTGYPKSQVDFFGTHLTDSLGDARALYDWVQGRFIVMADDFTNGNIWVATSATNDPRGPWYIYSFNLTKTGDFPDFPTLGQDRQAIYVGFTNFLAAGGISNYVMYLPKTQMYSGAAFSFNYGFNFNVGGTMVDSIQPANVMNKADNPRAEFMVNSYNINFGGGQCVNGCNNLVVWAVSNPLVVSGSPGPEVSGIVLTTANTYRLPPDARQSGCSSGSCLVDTGDTRISGQAIYSQGSLYAALNTKAAAGLGATIIWYRIDPQLNDNNTRCTGSFSNKCPDITGAIIREEECYFCSGRGTNGSNWYGTPQLDSEGNSTIVYAYSDDTRYPGLAYASKRVTSLTLHDAGLFLSSGTHFYQQLDDVGRNRWGDYTAVAPDFTAAATTYMWFAGEYSDSSGNWATRIGKNAFTSPAQP